MRWILVAVLTLFIILPVYAEELSALVMEAKANNPQILAAKKDWQAASSVITKNSTWTDPKLEFMYEQIPQSEFNPGKAAMRSYGLSQMVPFPGKLYLKRLAGGRQAEAARQMYLARELEIVAAVKSTYYKLFALEQAITINRENKALLASLAKAVEAKYVVSKASQHDLLKAQIELSLLVNDLITLEQRRQTTQASLNTLLYREPDALLSAEASLKLPALNFSLEELTEIARLNQPGLLARQAGWQASEQNQLLAAAGLLPDFNLKVLQTETATAGLNGWTAQIMLDLPLWFWRDAAAINEAGARKDSARASYDNALNLVKYQAQDAYLKVDASRRTEALFRTSIVPQAKQMLAAARQAYAADQIDFLTLINSQKTYQSASLNYFQAQVDYGSNLAYLEMTIGREIF